MGAEMALASVYQGRSIPGTSLSGSIVSGQDRQSLIHNVTESTQGYRVTIDGPSEKKEVEVRDMGIIFDAHMTAEAILSPSRRAFLLPYLLQARPSYGYSYSLDYAKLENFISALAHNVHVGARSASIQMKSGVAIIVPEQVGLILDQEKLLLDIVTAVEEEANRVALPTTTEFAPIKSSDLKEEVAQANKFASTEIEFTFEGKRFKPSPSEVGEWLTFPVEDGVIKVVADRGRVEQYLSTLTRYTDISPVSKKVTLINGEVKAEEGGVAGRALDKQLVSQQLIQALQAGRAVELLLATKEVPYRTVYNRSVSIVSGRYIEINLSLQHMWAYQDHQVVYSSPITSGATGAGFPTVQGLFSVMAKQRNRNLNGYAIGYNYNVFVQYWMPFYRDYGMHDASWRSTFGGPDYYYGGSHGCVNMPLATAAWLYEWASVGTPVWVHS